MHGFRKHVALLLLLTGLLFAAGACSGGGGSDSGDQSGGGSSGGETATYTNAEHGFSITYDARFTEGEPVTKADTGGEAVFSIVFADKDGPTVAGRYVNAIQISVYELARAVEPDEVPQLEQEVQGIVDQLMAAAPSAAVVEPLQEAEINGTPGYGFKYVYTEEGKEVTAVTFFLFDGQYEYQITGQATSEDWASISGALDTAVGTFTVQ